MDGFAFAAEALVGQAMGARAAARLRRAAILTSIWGLIICIVMAVLFLTVGGAFIDLMTTAPGVREAARDYLPWMVLAPLAGWASWMFDGIFIGATRTRDMRNMMALSFAGYVVLVLLLMPPFGNHGLWAALIGMFVLRGVTLAFRYPALERAAA
jgi:MATE family multidrug resistance protein